MKKIFSIILAFVSVFMFIIPTYATTVDLGPAYVFTFPDGTEVTYHLDESGYPYRIIDGERIYIALALEHLEVRDPAILAELQQREVERNTANSAITRSSSSVFDMSNCANDGYSTEYVVNATLSNTVFFETSTLLYNAHHTGLEINTDNHRPLTASNKISFIYYFYHQTYGRWYSLSFTGKDCSLGYAFQHSPSIYPKGYFKVLSYSNLKSCTIRIKTGPYLPSAGVPVY